MRFNPNARLDTSHINFHPGYRDTMPRKADGGILDDFPTQAFQFGGTTQFNWSGVTPSAKAVDNYQKNVVSPPLIARMKQLMLAKMKAMQQEMMLGSSGEGPGGAAPGGAARWAPVFSQALASQGQAQSWLATGLRRLMKESGGNPSIVNRWDSNWRAGHPSVGLMQVIGPTYGRYKDPRFDTGPYLYGTSINPMANITAAIRYTLRTYGNLARGWNRSGGYAGGGIIPTKIADRGGVVGSGQAFLNLSGRAERALTGRQNDNFERLVQNLDRTPMYSGSPDVVNAILALTGAVKSQSGGGNTFNNVFPITGEPRQTAAEVSRAQRVEAALGTWGRG